MDKISKSDKIEYNLLLARANKYASLPKELQDKHDKDFAKLIDKMDKLIFEMGVENASTDEWRNGFKIEEGEN